MEIVFIQQMYIAVLAANTQALAKKHEQLTLDDFAGRAKSLTHLVMDKVCASDWRKALPDVQSEVKNAKHC